MNTPRLGEFASGIAGERRIAMTASSKKKMSRIFIIALAAAFAAALPLLTASAQEGPDSSSADAGETGDVKYDPAKVIEKLDEFMRGDTSSGAMRMVIENPAWPKPREYEMRVWESRKAKKSFIRIVSPPREKGRAFLKDGNVFKVYIPSERENKPMTIPPSLMLQSWMGSDFTNDDLVRESSIVDDYKHTLEGVEKTDGGRVLLRVRMDPRPDAAVVWGKLVYWVRAEDYLPVKQVYYDEDGLKVRKMLLSEIENRGGREIPTKWEMIPLEEDKEGHKTTLYIDEMEFNVDIDEGVFTEKNLTRRDWE